MSECEQPCVVQLRALLSLILFARCVVVARTLVKSIIMIYQVMLVLRMQDFSTRLFTRAYVLIAWSNMFFP